MINIVLKKPLMAIGMIGLVCSSALVMAKISPEEAARLGQDLTPLGGEKAGNAEGTIPEWTGGGVEIPASYKPGGHHPDPFADEQPLFTITAENVDQYADKLSEGQLALFESYPDTFKMNVYPTHRTMKGPDWLYENTKSCATTADAGLDGNKISGAHACIPFPIPQTGNEVIWNHLLRYKGLYRVEQVSSAAPDARGRYVLEKQHFHTYSPYYDRESGPSGGLVMFIPRQIAPARVAGDTFLLKDYLDPAKNPRGVWKYFAGQRRVRRAPVFVFDTPTPPSQGLQTMDTLDMFFGSLEKYHFEIKGKREIYMGHNAYKLGAAGVSPDAIIQVGHINPELIRYELHRMWVVEATLKEGERHIYPRRTFFVNEDSWNILIQDMYDDKGRLWRTSHRYAKYYYEANVMAESNEVHHDLISKRYNVATMMGEYPGPYDYSKAPPGARFFTPASIRKMGVR